MHCPLVLPNQDIVRPRPDTSAAKSFYAVDGRGGFALQILGRRNFLTNYLTHCCVGGDSTGLPNKACPRLRDLATAPARGITQPRTNLIREPCTRKTGGPPRVLHTSPTRVLVPLCGSFCFCMNDVPSIFGVASLIRTMSLNLWLAAHVARTLARAQREFGNDGRVVGRSSQSNPVRQTRALWFIFLGVAAHATYPSSGG